MSDFLFINSPVKVRWYDSYIFVCLILKIVYLSGFACFGGLKSYTLLVMRSCYK